VAQPAICSRENNWSTTIGWLVTVSEDPAVERGQRDIDAGRA